MAISPDTRLQLAERGYGGGATAGDIAGLLGIGPSIRDWGAVGDGITDDTQAVMQALASIPNGGRLRFPMPLVGYRLGGVQVPNSVEIMGEGGQNGPVQIFPTSPTTTVFNVTGPFVRISNLSIGSVTGQQTAGAMIAVQSTATRFFSRDVTMNQFFDGFQINGSPAGVDIQYPRCFVYPPNPAIQSAAIHIYGGVDMRIVMPTVTGCHNALRTNGPVDGLSILDPRVYLCSNDGLQFNGGSNIRVLGGQIGQCGGSGIQFSAGMTNFAVLGGVFGAGSGLSGNAGYGILVINGSADYYQITGNLVLGNTTGAIFDGGAGLHKAVFSNPGDPNDMAIYRDGTTGFATYAGLQISFSGHRFLVNGTTEAVRINNQSGLQANAGLSAWGHAPPTVQPAAPATLADVIAIIRACGLSA